MARNIEAEELAMDLQWRISDHHYRGCVYDAAQDARYADDPRSEPTLTEVKETQRFAYGDYYGVEEER